MPRCELKPPFAYYGGKATLAPIIADLLPEHEHYVEPFAGSLAVLLAKQPSRAETVNDLDGDLMMFWRVLRDRPLDLERACFLTPHSREEYRLSREELSGTDLERARLVWVRLTQGRSHTLGRGRSGGWKYAHAAGDSVPTRLATLAGRIAPVADRLASVSLESRDALDVIRDYGGEPASCLYVDPPYLGSARAGTHYRVEMTADDAHQGLADALNACKASVVLSGYDSPLYADLFNGWHRLALQGATTLGGDTDRVEVLWSNRPLGEPDLLDLLSQEPA